MSAAETLTRDELVAALARHSNNFCRISVHGARIGVDGTRFNPDDDEIQIVARDLDPPLWRMVLHREPSDDVLDAIVDELRELWTEHLDQGVYRRTPDFHRWARALVRRLEHVGILPTTDAPTEAQQQGGGT